MRVFYSKMNLSLIFSSCWRNLTWQCEFPKIWWATLIKLIGKHRPKKWKSNNQKIHYELVHMHLSLLCMWFSSILKKNLKSNPRWFIQKKSNNIVWFPFSFEPYCGFALDQFGYWSCKNRQRFSTSSMWRQVEFISDGEYLQTLCVQVNRMHEVKGLGRWISYVSSLK
jgi:hypothetical protein